jgi:hypothetical protein
MSAERLALGMRRLVRVLATQTSEGSDMAATGDAEREVRTHANTYHFFTGLMKWGTILSFLVGMLVVFIIAN